LTGRGKRAAVTALANRTLGGSSLNCAPRIREALELLGPKERAELKKMAARASSNKLKVEGRQAVIEIGEENLMVLSKVGDSWYVDGRTLTEIEPFVRYETLSDTKIAEDSEETLE
jgi:hypothetical protein